MSSLSRITMTTTTDKNTMTMSDKDNSLFVVAIEYSS